MSHASTNEWIVSSLRRDDPSIYSDATTAKRSLSPIPTHLYLHFDINETILLGDDAGGDSRNESAQKMLAKSAYCRIPATLETKTQQTNTLEPTHWWDGQPMGEESSMPPLYTGWEWPEHCCPFYRTAYKKHAQTFTKNHGNIYSPILEACEASLRASKHYNIPSRSSRDGSGRPERHNTILPAFYETLRHLIEDYQKSKKENQTTHVQPFTVVFRTMGSDLSEIASVVTTFAKGEHPDYPHIDFPPLCLSEDRMYQGRWKADSDDATDAKADAVYQLWTSDESELVASGDSEILELLSGKKASNEVSVFGIRDDYNFWKSNNFDPTAGKPVWVPSHDKRTEGGGTPYPHHLIFDDNIYNLPDYGIVGVRKESPSICNAVSNETVDGGEEDHPYTTKALSFDTVHGKDLGAYQGIHLCRVPTVEPVLNPKWYIQQIEQAQSRLQLRLQSPLPLPSK